MPSRRRFGVVNRLIVRSEAGGTVRAFLRAAGAGASRRERGIVRKRFLWALGLAALGLLLAACAPNASQSTLEPVGEVAKQQKSLFVSVFWVAAVVFVIVEGGILFILFRYRQRKGRERMPKQTHGNTRLEIGWTILPAIVLAIVMVPTISMIWDLARAPDANALNITVKGYQWWWGFEYPDLATGYGDQKPVQIADVMVVPTGRQVYLSLSSEGGGAKDANDDPDFQVIHSFWVPQLFGKQDVVPGRTNHILFSVDTPGTYTGQCAEFCGLEHGRMKLRVVALEPAAWDDWVELHELSPSAPNSELAGRGEQIFLNPLSDGRGSCTACHSVGDAGGIAAPNLTHFADPTHECFAGCNWDTFLADGSPNAAALDAWLHDPGAVKQGAKMPNYDLSQDEIEALVAYLYSLK
jgi:cytochrome c oxidase subunit 2